MPALGHRAGALRCRVRTHGAWLLRAPGSAPPGGSWCSRARASRCGTPGGGQPAPSPWRGRCVRGAAPRTAQRSAGGEPPRRVAQALSGTFFDSLVESFTIHQAGALRLAHSASGFAPPARGTESGPRGGAQRATELPSLLRKPCSSHPHHRLTSSYCMIRGKAPVLHSASSIVKDLLPSPHAMPSGVGWDGHSTPLCPQRCVYTSCISPPELNCSEFRSEGRSRTNGRCAHLHGPRGDRQALLNGRCHARVRYACSRSRASATLLRCWAGTSCVMGLHLARGRRLPWRPAARGAGQGLAAGRAGTRRRRGQGAPSRRWRP